MLAKMSAAALACLAMMPLTSSAPANNHRNQKVMICHIPPGNPANAHVITISENAVRTHVELHGDFEVNNPSECPCGSNSGGGTGGGNDGGGEVAPM